MLDGCGSVTTVLSGFGRGFRHGKCRKWVNTENPPLAHCSVRFSGNKLALSPSAAMREMTILGRHRSREAVVTRCLVGQFLEAACANKGAHRKLNVLPRESGLVRDGLYSSHRICLVLCRTSAFATTRSVSCAHLGPGDGLSY